MLGFRFVLAIGFREIEKGFLKRNSEGLDGSMSSLLGSLVKKVMNIDMKLLGKDGKPLKAV